MSQTTIILPKGRGKKRLTMMRDFAISLIKLYNQIGFKISSRGWCYQLEGFGLLDKSQFNRVEKLINDCRKNGLLPIDFVAKEESRQFSGIETPNDDTPTSFLKAYLNASLSCEDYYTPNWWEGEEYYIQMIVEKIDVKTLFSSICKEYHIPIATTKGWSSMLQRAEYSRRFAKAEEKGLKCVLLYCGDHDPDGLRIADFLRSNLFDIQNINWIDGEKGYDPSNLIIERFGLNYDFIERVGLTWIDNLITGSGKNLASPSHRNHGLQYVQDYLRNYGSRKCEANAIIPIQYQPEGLKLCREAIEKYVGKNALDRFAKKHQDIVNELTDFRERTGLKEIINDAIQIIEDEENDT